MSVPQPASSAHAARRKKQTQATPAEQAKRMHDILSDPAKKQKILGFGVKEFAPLAKIAEFSLEALIELATQNPALARSVIVFGSDDDGKTN